jgi:chorismate mutase/prephenate dehydratase
MKIRIGFQGLIGCNSFRLIEEYFTNYKSISYLTIDDLFFGLEKYHIDCFVLPISNNTTGDINDHLDIINKYSNFEIIKKLPLKINHTLYGLLDSNLKNINKVVSHKEALKQCSNFIKNFELVETWNTFAGIEYIINKNDISIAAIAPLNIKNINIKELSNNISNNENNITNFIVIINSQNKENINMKSYFTNN